MLIGCILHQGQAVIDLDWAAMVNNGLVVSIQEPDD
jgi:hypothetical protein